MRGEKLNPLSDDCLAAESEQGACGACALPFKIARYGKARSLTDKNAIYARSAGFVKEAAKLENCSNYLLFRHYHTVDQVRLHAANFCKKHLLCPMCAIRRGAKMLDAYLKRYEVVSANHPDLVPYLVTLTIKNGPDLSERFRHLRGSMRSMSEARRNALKGQKFVEFAKSDGGFHSIEVTNRGNGWHPHVHMIWLCREKPSQAALSAEWLAVTGDSYVVDVRPLTDPVAGFLEVCKYALKFSDLDQEQLFEAYRVLTGRHLVNSYGLMFGVEIPESLTDESLDDLPYVELFYHYLPGRGYSYVPGGYEAWSRFDGSVRKGFIFRSDPEKNKRT